MNTLSLQKRREPASVFITSLGSRKEQILLGSAIAFGRYGVRGTTLREIAQAAGVSLTLLNHHFGSKLSLLASVVEAHHHTCERGVAQLRDRLQSNGGVQDLSCLLEAWLDHEFAHYDSPIGAHYLRLLVRLDVDPEVDGMLRHGLHPAAALAMDGLRHLFPDHDEAQLEAAWSVSSIGAYTAILDAQDGTHFGVGSDGDARQAAGRFVLAGLSALLIPQGQRA